MLKSCLQLIVVLLLVLRFRALLARLRPAWRPDRPDRLATDFQRELRRRGLLLAPPLRPTDSD